MTFPRGPGPDQADMLRRLRARPVSSWAHGSREAAMRAALQELADLAAGAGTRRLVPDAGVSALADQLAVLLTEARAAGVSGEAVAVLLGNLARDLGVRIGV